MALTSILAPAGDTAVFVFARGNGGVLSDIVAKGQGGMRLPALGGSCTYPSEDDVQEGVTFGDIYTGNLVVPAEVEVENGVGYGANGTEFTGTLVGGSEASYVF